MIPCCIICFWHMQVLQLGILTVSLKDPRDQIRDQHVMEPRTDYATGNHLNTPIYSNLHYMFMLSDVQY